MHSGNRGMSHKPPRNPTRNYNNTNEHPKQSTHPVSNFQDNMGDRAHSEERRASSLSKLGNQNYQNMVQNYTQGNELPVDQNAENHHAASLNATIVRLDEVTLKL